MQSRTAVGPADIAQDGFVYARWAVAALGFLFVVLPIVLLARRIGGGLHSPLPGIAYVASGLVYGAAAFGLRRAMASILPAENLLWRRMLTWLPSLCLLGVVASIWLPGTPIWAVVITLVALLAEETAAWRVQPAAWRFRGRWPLRTPERNRKNGSTDRSSAVRSRMDAAVLQRLTQRRNNAGPVVWQGMIRAEFAAEQRVAAAHVAFCPPFAAPPDVTAVQVEGPPSEVRVTQSLCNGARLEVKLRAAAAKASSAVIEFTAQAAGPK